MCGTEGEQKNKNSCIKKPFYISESDRTQSEWMRKKRLAGPAKPRFGNQEEKYPNDK